MSEGINLILEEYKISKDSIRAIMSQLATVVVSLLALSIAMLQFGTSAGAATKILLWYMVLLLVNFLVAYVVYQNVQITALQKHIARIEKKLGDSEVFMWESKIARIWYEGEGFSSKVLNMLVALPPLALFGLIYAGVALEVGLGGPAFYLPLSANGLYILGLGLGFQSIKTKIEKLYEIEQPETV